jgi:hypothetical protein
MRRRAPGARRLESNCAQWLKPTGSFPSLMNPDRLVPVARQTGRAAPVALPLYTDRQLYRAGEATP